ncbi:neutral zinc metallopeptidase [Actinocorallia sp. A-T 12471]|uniref:KPN_02809 family neutral zinc metallopeptidase n=1 Tax=Actinocorallia sp. A-T 12471 TaxID=3089813 RepID=UPI0029CC178B|nr:neutral zinc metallopeptidase [Actinocorallia sp. A-T 12471]MDX6742686.1 neutral zinc metallopeptidase [Actinocorallia sp. A-T 12471]
MDFNDDVRLDPSQVEVNRGGRGRGVAMGGGLVGLLGLIAALFFGVNPFEGQEPGQGAQQAPQQAQEASDVQRKCLTGVDAEQGGDCLVVGVVNSVQDYWGRVFANSGLDYTQAKTQLFEASTQTGCGYATSQVGPFYCPADQKVYLDLTFFDELQSKYGAQGGPAAQAYVIGHEYGHHVQNLLGVMNRVQQGTSGASSPAVRMELQADCYAGVWMRNAVQTGYLAQITQQDLDQALSAAQAVGDDRIQTRAQGYVRPDAFTHGTSAQRSKWLTEGYSSGDPTRCDTFRGAI